MVRSVITKDPRPRKTAVKEKAVKKDKPSKKSKGGDEVTEGKKRRRKPGKLAMMEIRQQVFKKEGLRPVFKYNPFKRDIKKMAAEFSPGKAVHMRKAAVEMIRDMVEARLLNIYQFAHHLSIEVGGMKTLKTKTFNICASKELRGHQEPSEAWNTMFVTK